MRHVRTVTTALALALFCLVPSAAHGADELGISPDGAHWASDLEVSLLDTPRVWVPGDSESTAFFVRNQAAQAGDLTLEARGRSAGSLLTSGDLVVAARVGTGEWSQISAPGSAQLATSRIEAGSQEKVDIRVRLVSSSGNVSQDRVSTFDLRVRLTEADLSSGPGDGGSDDGDGSDGGVGDGAAGPGAPVDPGPSSQALLPGTGAPRGLLAAALLGGLLVLAGVALAGDRKRVCHG